MAGRVADIFDPGATDLSEKGTAKPSTLWESRPQEQSYALLNDVEHLTENRYGQKIDLLDLTEHRLPADRSMRINDNPEVGCNPNRNKQHGFFFTADNCIGCHACEAACAEKNETAPHLAFRSVGYLEGGSFPDYQRLNISMACNHCDDPVCLKGCPTNAYTKHVEYGAVLQDPDICFGCGYCTWVCPYNAPQLDPVEGHVSKCNMCVDRLEVGLKPACVSACVGNALDFGVIENIPAGREQAKTTMPGFPDPNITRPNIRFQQTRTLPETMVRTDSNPLKYHQHDDGEYRPSIDRKHGVQRQWSFARLNSHENALVAFTLTAQAGIGLFTLLAAGALAGIDSILPLRSSALYVSTIALSTALAAFALLMSTTHLGRPLRFYRGFNNLKYSPVSREGLGIALFVLFAGVHLLLCLPAEPWLQDIWLATTGTSPPLVEGLATFARWPALLAITAGVIGLYYMVRCYRIPARPFWNHWQVGTAFFGNALSLGGMLALAAVPVALAVAPSLSVNGAIGWLGGAIWIGMLIEAVGLFFHGRAMAASEHEGGAAHYVQTTTFGKTYRLRNALLGGNLALVAALLVWSPSGLSAVALWTVAGSILVGNCIVSRALFYVLVIPTTMPGAFFWRNPAFEAHARETGLARRPQTGVV